MNCCCDDFLMVMQGANQEKNWLHLNYLRSKWDHSQAKIEEGPEARLPQEAGVREISLQDPMADLTGRLAPHPYDMNTATTSPTQPSGWRS